jgi:hypothetical protein
MTATLDGGTKKKAEPTAEEKVAEELVRRAPEQALSLTGPDGLLKQLTKTVLETAMNQEVQWLVHLVGIAQWRRQAIRICTGLSAGRRWTDGYLFTRICPG